VAVAIRTWQATPGWSDSGGDCPEEGRLGARNKPGVQTHQRRKADSNEECFCTSMWSWVCARVRGWSQLAISVGNLKSYWFSVAGFIPSHTVVLDLRLMDNPSSCDF
jgi:hypothetical protein